MPSDFEIKHDLLTIESIVIDLAKEDYNCWISFYKNSYGIKICRDEDRTLYIDIDIDNDNINVRYYISINYERTVYYRPENVLFENLGKKLREIIKKTKEKWEKEDEEEDRKIEEYRNRQRKNENNKL